MALFHRYKWLAAIAGVVLTGLPLLWLMSWLRTQGEAEVSITAHWSMGVTEQMIGRTVRRLNDLAARTMGTCQPSDLDNLRKAVFASGLIREISIVDPNGQTLCADTGRAFAARDVIASAATVDPTIMLDVVRIVESDQRMLRVRRLAPQRAPMLAALLQPTLFLPQVTPDGGTFLGYARMTLADGSLIATSGSEAALRDEHLVSRVQSGFYGPIITVAMQRSGIVANYDDLRRIGMVVTGLIAVLILLGALIIPRRLQQTDSTSEIEKALAAGEFVPYYQPIVDITSGKLLGAEVLVRWKKPDGAIISPGVFIPLVESSNSSR